MIVLQVMGRTYFQRQFYTLFGVQFLSAFNDNLFKNSLILFLTFQGISLFGFESNQAAALCSGVFILPFVLFSDVAGQLASQMNQIKLTQWTRGLEFFLVLGVTLSFYFQAYSLLLFLLFGYGILSAFIGVLKYSLVPEYFPASQWISINAWIESSSFAAILVGTICGGLLIAEPRNGPYWVCAVLLLSTLVGIFLSIRLPSVPSRVKKIKLNFNPFLTSIEVFSTRKRSSLFFVILCLCWFWFLSSTVLSLLPTFCKDRLQVTENIVTLFLCAFTVGIGIGSWLAQRQKTKMQQEKASLLSSFAMVFPLLDLAWISEQEDRSQLLLMRVGFDFLSMSLCGGVFAVILYSWLQRESESVSKSIAATNVLSSVGIVFSALLVIGLQKINVSLAAFFSLLAAMQVLFLFYMRKKI